MTRTTDPRVFSRIIRAAMRRRLVHLPLDGAPQGDAVHELRVVLEAEEQSAVWILAEPAGAASGGLWPMRLQPQSRVQAAQLYALAHLGGAASSFPPDEEPPPSMRVDSEAPAIAYSRDGRFPVGRIAVPVAPLPAAIPRELLDVARPAAPPPIAGRYRLGQLLGEGATGAVYQAHDLAQDRQVAIKILHHAKLGDAQVVKRFKAEARAASRLDHVNVTGVLDAGEESSGRLYLVMEYVSGQTLEDVLARARILPPLRAIGIAAQVCSALTRAHEQGIVHRDIKPENIMLVAGNERDSRHAEIVKVCDFGVAKFMDPDAENANLTVAGAIFGSPPYMSPEQAAGAALDFKSDLYSLGVTLYEMTTGRLPFVGESLIELMNKHMHEPPTRPSNVVAGYDSRLEAIVLRLLAKAPRDRPASARDVRADLRVLADALAAGG
jgi:serine/threonine-protein kinase